MLTKKNLSRMVSVNLKRTKWLRRRRKRPPLSSLLLLTFFFFTLYIISFCLFERTIFIVFVTPIFGLL